MKDKFSFDVAYTVRRCCECPHFREEGAGLPYCSLTFRDLNIDYHSVIHKDCLKRKEN